MKKVWTDRRLFIAFLSVVLLFILGYVKDVDVAQSMVMVTGFIAIANAGEAIYTKIKNKNDKADE